MSKNIINYCPELKHKANNLRQIGILAEVIMWNKIKGGQILNYRFRRQKPIGPYIVDFYCPRLKLVIEIDGYSHEDKIDYDQKRDRYLQNLNLKSITF
jgi:very-short-patch-repair endonuclease